MAARPIAENKGLLPPHAEAIGLVPSPIPLASWPVCMPVSVCQGGKRSTDELRDCLAKHDTRGAVGQPSASAGSSKPRTFNTSRSPRAGQPVCGADASTPSPQPAIRIWQEAHPSLWSRRSHSHRPVRRSRSHHRQWRTPHLHLTSSAEADLSRQGQALRVRRHPPRCPPRDRNSGKPRNW